MKFETDYPGAVAALKGEVCFTLDYSRDRLLHGVSQLSNEQLWHRPHAGSARPMNAVGNMVQHACGNLRQWVIVGCDPTRQAKDERDRDGEFATPVSGAGPSVGALSELLRQTIEEAKATVRAMNKDHLLEPRLVQGFEVTGMGAVWHSVSHLEGHAQEVIYATRMMLGEGYVFKDEY